MSRIDAPIATQVADTSRPQQVTLERQLQTEEAKRAEQKEADNGPTSSNVSHEQVRAAAAQVKQVLEAASGHQLDFKLLDEERATSGELALQIRDQKTGKVIKQIPGEDVVKMQQRIHDLVGMIFDKKG
jgi:flagellar protein FlaG